MKICIFTNHFFPEDFKVNDIAFELANLGYDITVLTAIPDYPQGKFYSGYSFRKRRREVVNNVEVIRLPVVPRGKGNKFQLVLNYISYYISLSIFTFFHAFKNKYDCIFVHLTSPFFPGVCARYLSKRQHIPLLFWVLDLWPESLISAGGITNSFIINAQIRMVKKVYEQCSKILISSKGFEKSICEKGSFKEKIVYFPNWAESLNKSCSYDLNIDAISPFNSQDANNFILLFAGNLGEAQNLDAVLYAAKLLKDKKRIKFVFVGDGRKKAALERYVTEQELCETVYFIGRYPIESMPIFMRKANVLMVSLKDELCFNLTVPAKVQFYMAQAKPILAMLNGDGADIIHDAQCGCAVPAGDTIAFARAIEQMSEMNTTDLSLLGKNAKNYYERHFAKGQRIQQLCELITQSTK